MASSDRKRAGIAKMALPLSDEDKTCLQRNVPVSSMDFELLRGGVPQQEQGSWELYLSCPSDGQ